MENRNVDEKIRAADAMRSEPNLDSPFVKMAKELERLKATSRDIVASTKDIKAEAISPSDLNLVDKKPELLLAVNGKGEWPLTHHGHGQLAAKCGIPERYYWAMLEAGMTELTAENANAWLSKQADKRLVRIADGQVRALLSDRYRCLDNFDLATLVMDRAYAHRAKPVECQLTETRMYIKLLVPEQVKYLKSPEAKAIFQQNRNAAAHEIMRNFDPELDPHIPGIVVSNSEVGSGAFRVEPFIWRIACANGLIGTESMYKIHLGREMDIGELLKDDTKKLLDQALWSKARDIIDLTFNGTLQDEFFKKLQKAKELVIEKPTETVDVTAKNLSLSDEHRDSLLGYFAQNGYNVFGIVNAITNVAQDFENYDRKIELERYAGQVLEKPELVIAK